MALVKFGGGVAAMSGSIGGTTFARSKAGAYARQWTKPVNPRSPLQNARRAFLAYLATYWSKTCTDQQRIDWSAYADGTSWTNKLGESITINGNAAFIRLNTIGHIAGQDIRADAPTAMGHAGGVTLAFTADSALDKLQIAEPGGAFDPNVDNQFIAFFQGLPSEPGRISTPKGFKFIGHIWGDSGAPMMFPTAIMSAYTIHAGQLVTIKGMFIDEHYRVSGPSWANVLAADV